MNLTNASCEGNETEVVSWNNPMILKYFHPFSVFFRFFEGSKSSGRRPQSRAGTQTWVEEGSGNGNRGRSVPQINCSAKTYHTPEICRDLQHQHRRARARTKQKETHRSADHEVESLHCRLKGRERDQRTAQSSSLSLCPHISHLLHDQ